MKHVLGKCPQCAGQVVEFRNFYGCTNWRKPDGACPFTLPKTFAGREIPAHVAADLIKNRCTKRLSGFVSQAGNNFEAKLELQFNGSLWRLKMQFTG